jgi:hypothetical protein
VDIFRRSGFEVIHLTYKAARPGQALPEKIHKDFSNYSVEELTAGNIIVVLKPMRR